MFVDKLKCPVACDSEMSESPVWSVTGGGAGFSGGIMNKGPFAGPVPEQLNVCPRGK